MSGCARHGRRRFAPETRRGVATRSAQSGREMNHLNCAEGRKRRFRTDGAMPKDGREGPSPLSDAFEWVCMALTLAAGALLLWLWCAGTPPQRSAEADFEAAQAAHQEDAR